MVDHVPWQLVPVVWVFCLAGLFLLRREQIRRARAQHRRKP